MNNSIYNGTSNRIEELVSEGSPDPTPESIRRMATEVRLRRYDFERHIKCLKALESVTDSLAKATELGLLSCTTAVNVIDSVSAGFEHHS